MSRISNHQNEVTKNIGRLAKSQKSHLLPISRIKIDPDNARTLLVNTEDLPFNPDKSNDQQKIAEYHELLEMGLEIKRDGLINPITVYQNKEGDFVIIAGHRRFLASMITSQDAIQAIVKQTPENDYEIARLQWNENDKRKNLKLNERLKGLKRLISSYTDVYGKKTLDGKLLSELANCSESQSRYYLRILNIKDSGLNQAIEHGDINNLEKAYYVAGLPTKEERISALSDLKEGMSLSEVKPKKNQPTEINSLNKINQAPRAGRIAKQINFGKSKEINTGKFIIESLLNLPELSERKKRIYENMNLNDCRDLGKSFQLIVGFLDKKLGQQ